MNDVNYLRRVNIVFAAECLTGYIMREVRVCLIRICVVIDKDLIIGIGRDNIQMRLVNYGQAYRHQTV